MKSQKRDKCARASQPYGRKADYVEDVKNADLTKMAELIKIVGVCCSRKFSYFGKINGDVFRLLSPLGAGPRVT